MEKEVDTSANYFAKVAKELELDDEVSFNKNSLQQCEKFMPKYLLDKLMNQAVTPDAKHLKLCKCSQPFIDAARKAALEKGMKQYDANNLKERDFDGTILKRYKDKAYDEECYELIEHHFKKNNLTCVEEKKEIFKTLVLFANKYDFNDPRVFVIVDSLIHQMLSAHRMQLFSNQHGIINVWYDRQDNKRMSLNPVEELKLKYDEARISAIATLDKIMEGNKVNLLGNIKVRDIDDVFKDVMDLEEGSYKKL